MGILRILLISQKLENCLEERQISLNKVVIHDGRILEIKGVARRTLCETCGWEREFLDSVYWGNTVDEHERCLYVFIVSIWNSSTDVSGRCGVLEYVCYGTGA